MRDESERIELKPVGHFPLDSTPSLEQSEANVAVKMAKWNTRSYFSIASLSLSLQKRWRWSSFDFLAILFSRLSSAHENSSKARAKIVCCYIFSLNFIQHWNVCNFLSRLLQVNNGRINVIYRINLSRKKRGLDDNEREPSDRTLINSQSVNAVHSCACEFVIARNAKLTTYSGDFSS